MKKQLRIPYLLLLLFIATVSKSNAQAEYNEEYQVLKINNLLKEVAKNFNHNVIFKIRVENGVLFIDKSNPGVYTSSTRVGLNRIKLKSIKQKDATIEFKTIKNKKFVSFTNFPKKRYSKFTLSLEDKKNKEKNAELVELFKELVEKYQ